MMPVKIIAHGIHSGSRSSYYPNQLACPECKTVFLARVDTIHGSRAVGSIFYSTECPGCCGEVRVNVDYNYQPPKPVDINLRLPLYKVIQPGSSTYSKEQMCKKCECVFRIPLTFFDPTSLRCPECYDKVDPVI
jgi:hypothetical protein